MPHAIVVTLRANYYGIFLLFLDSMKHSFPEHPEIVVLQKGFSADQIDFLQKHYERLRIVDMLQHRYLKGPPMLGRMDCDIDAFYARFLIWTDFCEAYDNVLYLDIDTFVTGSLAPVLSSREFLCFQDAYTGPQPFFYRANDPALATLLREDALVLPKRPGNGGVLLVPRRYRTVQQLALLQYFLVRYNAHLIWGDQSLINLWMAANEIQPTNDYRYNFQARLLQHGGELKAYWNVCLFHMNGWNHLDCTETLIRIAWAFFFRIPGGRAIFPVCFWIAMRADTARLRFGVRVLMEGVRLATRGFRRVTFAVRPATTSTSR